MTDDAMKEFKDEILNKAFKLKARNLALEAAINAKCGQAYTQEGNAINDPDKLVEAAKKIEAYLIGEKTNEDV